MGAGIRISTELYLDSHCHVQDAAFDVDRDAVLKRAYTAGVQEIVAIGAEPGSAERARVLAEARSEERPRVWFTAGLHPHEASRWGADARAAIAAHLSAGAVAVGEIGLDFHYEHSSRAMQSEAFAAQLGLAADHNLPVVIHSRDAEEETLAILADSGLPGERIVLHCFSGSRAMLDDGVALGCYVSFSGMVTFRTFPAADLVPGVPYERLLAETDAPYLAPVPHRGKRNEPGWVVKTVAALAALRGVGAEEMAAATRANARRFYGLDRKQAEQ